MSPSDPDGDTGAFSRAGGTRAPAPLRAIRSTDERSGTFTHSYTLLHTLGASVTDSQSCRIIKGSVDGDCGFGLGEINATQRLAQLVRHPVRDVHTGNEVRDRIKVGGLVTEEDVRTHDLEHLRLLDPAEEEGVVTFTPQLLMDRMARSWAGALRAVTSAIRSRGV